MADAADPQDPLGVLREHVRSAQQAAERLAAQAGEAGPARRGAVGGGADAGPAGAGTAGAGPASPGAGEPDPGRAGAEGRGGTPPSGWASPEEREAAAELRALVGVVESLRNLLPEELREQVTELIRQILVLLRAIIDWLVSRLERERRGADASVEDIPVL